MWSLWRLRTAETQNILNSMLLPLSHSLTLIDRLALHNNFSSPFKPSSHGLPMAHAQEGKAHSNKRNSFEFMICILDSTDPFKITNSTQLMTKCPSKLKNHSPCKGCCIWHILTPSVPDQGTMDASSEPRQTLKSQKMLGCRWMQRLKKAHSCCMLSEGVRTLHLTG